MLIGSDRAEGRKVIIKKRGDDSSVQFCLTPFDPDKKLTIKRNGKLIVGNMKSRDDYEDFMRQKAEELFSQNTTLWNDAFK